MRQESQYWIREARESMITAQALFEKKRYLESAFFCHLTAEKALKAHYAFTVSKPAPKTHNLLLLAAESHTLDKIPTQYRDLLAELMPFQIEGRYPVDRQRLIQDNTPEMFGLLLKKRRSFSNG